MRDRREACALPRDVPVRGEIVEAELPDPAQGVLVRALGPRERLHGSGSDKSVRMWICTWLIPFHPVAYPKPPFERHGIYCNFSFRLAFFQTTNPKTPPTFPSSTRERRQNERISRMKFSPLFSPLRFGTLTTVHPLRHCRSGARPG